mgnify:CR=1 FL=1|tara:strand:+ start:638 stop:2071 length:1434 start_codon:yes stop_codon:yes gene_type:complete
MESSNPTNPNWGVVLVVGSGVLMSTIDGGSINVILPTIAEELGEDLPVVQWVVLAYLLGMSGLMLSFGRLSDIVGRKKIALMGFAIYGSGAILCSVSPHISFLIGSRIYESIGAAMLQSTGPALMVGAFPTANRGRAMGVNGSIVSIGLLLGPLVGGTIAELVEWRLVFLTGLPFALLALAIGPRLLIDTKPSKSDKFDVLSAVLLLLWIAALIYALNQGQRIGWDDYKILTATGFFISGITVFLFRQIHIDHPLIELRVFRLHTFTLSLIISVLTFTSVAGLALLTPFLLQNVVELKIGQIGLVMALIPAGSVSFAFVGGTIVDRFGPRLPATMGLLVMSGATFSFAFVDESTQMHELAIRALCVGTGQGLFMSPNASSIMGALPYHRLGMAGGFLAWARNFGFSAGQAVWGAVFTAVVTSHSGVTTTLDSPIGPLLEGFQVIYIGGATLLIICASMASTRGRVSTPSEIPGLGNH